MDLLGPYNLIIEASVILIISYFFGEISKKTSIPSVLMLIVLGIIMKLIIDYMGAGQINFFRILEVLGIVGLIMIVLEAALELKLKRDKILLISKAFGIALVSLLLTAWGVAITLEYFVEGMDTLSAWVYATPLSILSSSIIIPSVVNMRSDKKEFHIYEGTFSDILGIMLFYFLVEQGGSGESGGIGQFGVSTILTLVLSVFFSYLILIVFQNIKSSVKLFLLISVLMLLYSVGKKMHLSSLLIILVFGLVIANFELFFSGKLSRFIDKEKAQDIYKGLHVITMETAFVVRTFFFVIFGITITFNALADLNVMGVSFFILIITYVVRYIMLRSTIGQDIFPQLYIAPRGLITILLFYAIPVDMIVPEFSQGILLYIILGTGVIMTISMIMDKKRTNTAVRKAKSLPISSVKWRAPGIEE